MIQLKPMQIVILIMIMIVLAFVWMETRELRMQREICSEALEAMGYENATAFDCSICNMCMVFCGGHR